MVCRREHAVHGHRLPAFGLHFFPAGFRVPDLFCHNRRTEESFCLQFEIPPRRPLGEFLESRYFGVFGTRGRCARHEYCDSVRNPAEYRTWRAQCHESRTGSRAAAFFVRGKTEKVFRPGFAFAGGTRQYPFFEYPPAPCGFILCLVRKARFLHQNRLPESFV